LSWVIAFMRSPPSSAACHAASSLLPVTQLGMSMEVPSYQGQYQPSAKYPASSRTVSDDLGQPSAELWLIE
jgi:hypothetical protein